MFKEVKEYTFFDGVNQYNVTDNYDNWLSSCEFSVYSQSYVKINVDEINLFGPQTKKIEVFYIQNKELFEDLNKKLNFLIEEKEVNCYAIYNSKKKYEDYYITFSEFNDNNYIVFYSLGGSRFIESITIYGVMVQVL